MSQITVKFLPSFAILKAKHKNYTHLPNDDKTQDAKLKTLVMTVRVLITIADKNI